jgi:hypothetical protein
VRRRVAGVVAADDAQAVKAYLASLARVPVDTPGHRRPEAEVVAAQVRRYLTVESLQQAYLAATTGVTTGKVRLGLVGGYLAQLVLFVRDLEREPVSMAWFRLVWPLVRSRRVLMPLVRQKGIYCFYSRRLVRQLAALIGDRRCLEIAAGDGTLSAFLAAQGVDITATDDRSWSEAITYPEQVLCQSAGKALRVHQPQVVLCSWPPAGNSFERQVFAIRSVDLYIVVTTRHELSAGDRTAYREQRDFDLIDDVKLGGWCSLPTWTAPCWRSGVARPVPRGNRASGASKMPGPLWAVRVRGREGGVRRATGGRR